MERSWPNESPHRIGRTVCSARAGAGNSFLFRFREAGAQIRERQRGSAVVVSVRAYPLVVVSLIALDLPQHDLGFIAGKAYRAAVDSVVLEHRHRFEGCTACEPGEDRSHPLGAPRREHDALARRRTRYFDPLVGGAQSDDAQTAHRHVPPVDHLPAPLGRHQLQVLGQSAEDRIEFHIEGIPVVREP